MKNYILILTTLFLLSCSNKKDEIETPEELKTKYTTKVIKIIDGDTIVLLENEKEITISFAEIDAPEITQPFGEISKQRVTELLLLNFVEIKTIKKDKYGKFIADIFFLYRGENIAISKQLLFDGLAWHYKEYSNNDLYSRIEQTSKRMKIGLWQDENPINPSDWRKTH